MRIGPTPRQVPTRQVAPAGARAHDGPVGPRAAVMTVATWHDSLGDIAIGAGTLDALSQLGVPARAVDGPGELLADDVLVIGGGDLLTPAPPGEWWDALSAYRVAGNHILNGAGLDVDSVSSVNQYRYLQDYRLVSVRDEPAADLLSRVVDDVQVVPCLATLTPTIPWDDLVCRPGYENLRHLTPGTFDVIHRHPDLEELAKRTGRPSVVLDMQAWQNHKWDGPGIQVTTRSAQVGVSIVAHSRQVVTRSLHLAIFALAGARPFAVLDPGDRQSRKCRAYLRRAGAESAVTTDVSTAFDCASDAASSVDAWSASEKQLCWDHANAIKVAVGAGAPPTS